jgi:hypothetical protein
LSNALAYTVTIDGAPSKCAALAISGPAAGNVTIAGASTNLVVAGDVSMAATGITFSATSNLYFGGNGSYLFLTNGNVLSTFLGFYFVGVGTYTLTSALSIGTVNTINFITGTFDTSVSNYSVTAGSINSSVTTKRILNFNGSTITLNQITSATFNITNLTYNAGTSTLNCAGSSPTVSYNGTGNISANNLSFTTTGGAPLIIVSATAYLTLNNLTFANTTTTKVSVVAFSATTPITIAGTLTLGNGTTASCRTMLISSTVGRQVTLSVNAAAASSDIDFADIAITGAASPIAPTRAGDCKGNSGITFPAPKTVYYSQTGNSSWGSTGAGSWSATSGGALDATMFPLAQDTAVFPAATYPASGSTVTINSAYNIGTIDMSLRTSNTMTLAFSLSPIIYGNWVNGTGITLSGSGSFTFSGRTTQTLTSAGKTFLGVFTINSPGGSVTLQDAITLSIVSTNALLLTAGTFDANGYNVTLSSAGTAGLSISGTNTRTFAVGSGTVTLAGSGTAWNASTSTNLTVTGTGTINLTNGGAKTFAGGGVNYSGITLNQGGAGALSITGNNTFKNISNTYTGLTTISLANTTQTVSTWTAKGLSGFTLFLSGTSAASPATLVYTGSGSIAGLDYLNVTNCRAYPTTSTWYAGSNSSNNGSLGFIFATYVPPVVTGINGQFFAFF